MTICLFVFDRITAKNKQYLKMLGITHLLNAAEGKRFGFVHTDRNYYKDTRIIYLGLPMADLPSTDISRYFFTSANFIEDSMRSSGESVFH